MSDQSPAPAGSRRPIIRSPPFNALDRALEKYWLKLSAVERLTTGCAGRRAGVVRRRALSLVQRHSNHDHQVGKETSAVSIFRKPSNFANGNTRDRKAGWSPASMAGAVFIRTNIRLDHGADDSFNGKRLNARNDVVVKFRRLDLGSPIRYSVWLADYERLQRPNPRSTRTSTGSMVPPERPPSWAEGILGPQRAVLLAGTRNILYIIESRGVPTARFWLTTWRQAATRSQQAHVRRRRPGHPDGMRADIDGNLWCGWGMAIPNSTASWCSRRWRHDRPHRTARTLRQPLLRRLKRNRCSWPRAIDLRAVCEHARRVGGITRHR